MSDSVYFMRQDGVYRIGPESIPRKVSYSVADDPRKWGTPDKLRPCQRDIAEKLRFINGSTFSHHHAYSGTWASEPVNFTIKRNPMKPGPFKSSTHGNIPLSMKGRELLAAERDAVIGALKEKDLPWQGGISHARGELAKYMGELEANQKPCATETYKWGGFMVDDRKRAELRHVFNSFGTDFSKYFPQTEDNKVTNAPQIPEEVKTRSQLLTDASRELVQAQRELERIQDAPSAAPDIVTVSTLPCNAMSDAVALLVKEQWPTLAKKAVARAKARVAKAEKAVSALLGS